MIFGNDFAQAARDYRLLLDKGYPVNASIKLVGDRYRLDKALRMVLFRGVLDGSASARNEARVLSTLPSGSHIALDGYNVLFTLTNYLRGHPVFISTDGLLRDAGGAHGRVADSDQFLSAIDRLCRSLARLSVARATVYLDSPVPKSALHAEALRKALNDSGLKGEVYIAPSADKFLIDCRIDAIATSDSAIVAKAAAPVFDLARCILESEFGARFERIVV